MSTLMTTAVAASLVGVPERTLRQWAKTGRVVPATVSPGGQRRWDVEDLRRQLADAVPSKRVDGMPSPTTVASAEAEKPRKPPITKYTARLTLDDADKFDDLAKAARQQVGRAIGKPT